MTTKPFRFPERMEIFQKTQFPTINVEGGGPRENIIRELKMGCEFAGNVFTELQKEYNIIRQNKNLSEAGIKKMLSGKALSHIKNIRDYLTHESNPIKKARAAVAEIQGRMAKRIEKPNDPAAAIRDMEIRAYVRALPPEKSRQEFLNECYKNGDYDTLFAVANAPCYLSGVNPLAHKFANEALLREAVGEDVQVAECLQMAADAAERALKFSREWLLTEGDFLGLTEEGTLSDRAESVPKAVREAHKETFGFPIGLSKEGMTLQEKSAFVSQYGAEAFERLPLHAPDSRYPTEPAEPEPVEPAKAVA